MLDSTGFGAFPAYAFADDVRLSYALEYCTLDVGMNEIQILDLHAYPVPTAGALHISGNLPDEQFLQYALVDVHGRVVQQGMALTRERSLSIDTQGLANGAYILDLTIDPDRRSRLPFIRVSP